ncbi:MAG: MFS transporter, partial [Alphaproteobacteria bacterium]|nr:MFS transporter [Alphaproteobacteria bacterium]
RLWGSVTFIAASVLGGPMLARFGPWSVLWAILALVLVVLLACALLPDERPARAARGSGPVLGLMRQPVFLLFLCTGGLIHASHAVLLGFGTLHWRSIGFSDGIIGALWAEGVIAEILLFVVSGRAVRRIGVANLLVLGAGGAVVRWTAMGLSDALWLAFVMQALHGLTFGAAHLGAMHFIARAAPDAWSATAQSLHGAVGGGIAVGLTMAAAGALYQRFDNGAYLVMAGVAALAVLAALMLARRWDGGPLVK